MDSGTISSSYEVSQRRKPYCCCHIQLKGQAHHRKSLMHKYRHALMMSIIFHTMKTIGKSTSALQFTTNHNDGAIRDVLVGCLSPLPHSGRHSSELPLALRPSNKHYWKCARIAPESMMISSCFTFRLTLFCVSPLSLRPGLDGLCRFTHSLVWPGGLGVFCLHC